MNPLPAPSSDTHAGTPPPLFFVTGTDTGVGKTTLSLLLMLALRKTGQSPFYCKPVQTGCRSLWDEAGDPAFIARYFAQYVTPCNTDIRREFASGLAAPSAALQIPVTALHVLAAPKSPWHAACDAEAEATANGNSAASPAMQDLAPAQLARRIRALYEDHTCLVLEGAGGLMAPLDGSHCMIDLLLELAFYPDGQRPAPNAVQKTAMHDNTIRDHSPLPPLRILLAARSGLGSINHTLLSLEALKNRGLNNVDVIFIRTQATPPPLDLEQNNLEAIHRFSGITPLGIVPWIPSFVDIPDSAFTPVRQLLRKLYFPFTAESCCPVPHHSNRPLE